MSSWPPQSSACASASTGAASAAVPMLAVFIV